MKAPYWTVPSFHNVNLQQNPFYIKINQSAAFLSYISITASTRTYYQKMVFSFLIFCYVIQENVQAITQFAHIKLKGLPLRGHHASINFPKRIFAIHFSCIYDPSVSTLIKQTNAVLA